jgi:hypothetical protein
VANIIKRESGYQKRKCAIKRESVLSKEKVAIKRESGYQKRKWLSKEKVCSVIIAGGVLEQT